MLALFPAFSSKSNSNSSVILIQHCCAQHARYKILVLCYVSLLAKREQYAVGNNVVFTLQQQLALTLFQTSRKLRNPPAIFVLFLDISSVKSVIIKNNSRIKDLLYSRCFILIKKEDLSHISEGFLAAYHTLVNGHICLRRMLKCLRLVIRLR